jgi:ribonuclease HI|tara:strand:+ start:1227 stop:1784 length:558 start_codon:yes stop_codon:yes gene_type:complete
MKQTKLEDFFNIKYKNKKTNPTPTPNNTPTYGSFDNNNLINKISTIQLNDKLKKYVLRFDGASKGNPGKSGAGAVLYENDIEISCISEYLGIRTNNYAECYAMILGIDEAFRIGIKNLEVEGDSMLIINQLKGKWCVKNKDLKNLYSSIRNQLKSFNTITYTHIYRDNNKRADELANIGVSKAKM